MAFQTDQSANLSERPADTQTDCLPSSVVELLFIAGQIAWNEKHEIVSDDFVEQFDQALANVIAVVNEAGGKASDIARLDDLRH